MLRVIDSGANDSGANDSGTKGVFALNVLIQYLYIIKLELLESLERYCGCMFEAHVSAFKPTSKFGSVLSLQGKIS